MELDKHPVPVQRESANPLDDRLDQLRDLHPEAFTEGKLDLDKFHAAIGHFADDRPERYTFACAGKRNYNVLDAYGWPHDLTDDQILERLLALNLQRAAKQEA